MLSPYPLRSRSNSTPPRPYTALLKRKQQQLEKQKLDAEFAEAQAEAQADLPARPPRNAARLSRLPIAKPSDHLQGGATTEAPSASLASPITVRPVSFSYG